MKKEPVLYFPEQRGNCSISISKKPISKRGDHTLQTWSSADPLTIARLARTNGNLALDIYDEKSRLFARMEFSSLATLLCVLSGGNLESLSTGGYGYRIPKNLKRLGWMGAILWLRSILPTFFETLGNPQSSEKISNDSDDSWTELCKRVRSERSS
jgi:hypothetical protein